MSSAPTPSLFERFAYVIALLCEGIVFRTRVNSGAAEGYRHKLPDSLLTLLWQRVKGVEKRFMLLLARFQAGTLPPPRVRVAPAVAAVEAVAVVARGPVVRAVPLPDGGFDRFPSWMVRTKGWMLRLAPAGTCAGFYARLLEDTELQALTSASPEAARLVRSLCWMLAVDPPSWLPAKPVRPKRVRPPSPEALAKAERRAIIASVFAQHLPPFPAGRRPPRAPKVPKEIPRSWLSEA